MIPVVIKNSCTVVPASKTPTGRLSLSEFDQPRHYALTPLLFVYKPKTSTSTSTSNLPHTIQSSLSRALVHFYPLAGRLRWIGAGRMEIHCNAAGAHFLDAESPSDMDVFTDFEPTSKIEILLPKIDYSSPIQQIPVLSVRLTRFACGGFTIGIAISHAVVDGGSFTFFVGAWAKLARGESLSDDDMPSHDRFTIGAAHAPPRFDHVEYKPLPLLIGRSDCVEEQSKPTTISMLKLTKPQLDRLKNRANENQKHPNRAHSIYETVTAHIWRSACKARNLETGQRTVIRLIVDCRSRMKPPLAKNYPGNAILFTITDPKCVAGDLVANPLSYAAGKVREAVESFTHEYIVSALNLIAGQKDVSKLIRKPEGSGEGGQFLGNPNLLVVSWFNVAVNNSDYGFGKPKYVRPSPAAMDTDGKVVIAPSLDGDGSVDVMLRLQTEHLVEFKKVFYEDIAPRL